MSSKNNEKEKLELKKRASGSFPPLYYIGVSEPEVKEVDKKRSFSTATKVLTIKEIMDTRREDKNVFLSI